MDPHPGGRGAVSPRLGPAALQVLIHRLQGVAEEMGAVLRRSAFSPNIKERADCSAAVFDASGQLLAQAEHIPVHLGSMPASVLAAVQAASRLGRELRPGDLIALNDPYAGGTHLNDLTLVSPCLRGGELVGWVANRAHHADVGGMVAGSIPPEASQIYQEGLRLPPVLLTPEVVELVCANSRTPAERRGDLEAQAGANAVGAARLAELAGDAWAFDEVLDYGERRMAAALAKAVEGCFSFEDVLDPPAGSDTPARIALILSLAEGVARFDFSGTSPQQPGNLNAVEAVTLSAVAFSLRVAADPSVPANAGSLRPLRLVAPPGTVVAARPPAAVGAGNVEVSQRVADVCLGALAQAFPGRVPAAGQGTMNNLMLGGDGWVYYETVAGGQGARPGRAGMSGVHTGMTNTQNTPIEALERELPLRVLRYRLRSGSGGRGRWPGGEGVERAVQVLEPASASLVADRRHSRPFGLAGGQPGAAGEDWLWPGGDPGRRRRLPAKATFALEPGDVVQLLTPGGGGYGEPAGEA
jgi:N-methylhydantoinase B/oxoprolinase/acetone carboxylase alpha subunit